MWTSWPWVLGASLRAAPYEMPVDREPPPRDPAREDDRARPEDVAAVEMHLPRRGVDPRDRPGHENLGAEPARLLQRAAGELVPRHSGREPEVVLDPCRGARLPAGRLALHHDRPQPLRRAVRAGGQAGGARANDHRVVLGGERLCAEPQQLRHPPEPGPDHCLAVDDPDRRQVTVSR